MKPRVMQYDFDLIVDRENTDALKYELRERIFGREDILPFWVADMDFKTPDFVLQALKNKLTQGILGYPSISSDLVNSIRVWLLKRHNWEIDTSWISVEPGVVPTLAFCVQAFTRPGDEVIVQPPVYFPFFYTIKQSGRIQVDNPLIFEKGRYQMDLADLKKKIGKRTKMIFLCNPHNPGGSVWRREELEELGQICLENGILIVSDEIHSDLVLFGNRHIPMASISDEIAMRTITCLSASKTFNVAGLSTSYSVIKNQELRQNLDRVLNGFHLSLGNALGMEATCAAYKSGENWLTQLLKYLEENILYVERFLKKNVRSIGMVRPEGTYLIWLDFRHFGLNSEEVKDFLINRAGLALSDGRLFGTGGSGYQRLNIACPRTMLEKGMYQLQEAVNRLKST